MGDRVLEPGGASEREGTTGVPDRALVESWLRTLTGYDILREGETLNHLADTAVPVPKVLAAESDPRFFGAPFLLLESIDAPHMPAPEVDPDTLAADLRPSPRRSPRSTRSTGGRRDWSSSAYRVHPRRDSRAKSMPLRGACRRSVAATTRC